MTYKIRPILRGRDIKRYGYEWANLYLIATFPSRHYDIEKYPAVKEYLLSFGMERLEQTGKSHVIRGEIVKARKSSNNKWFETQDNISYWDDFFKPKIIYPETTQGAYFVYDNRGFMLDKTCFMLITNDAEYLQLTLSRKLFEFAYKHIFSSVSLGDHGYQYNKHALLKLPIYKPHSSILIEKDELDKQIYKLYNISEQEIKEIESC